MHTAKVPVGAADMPRFDGEIERVGPGIFYRLALPPVALVMLVLPLLYIGFIGVVAWATYWHAVSNTGILSSMGHSRTAVVARLFGYCGPLFCGGTLVVFLLKPLFARPAQEDFPLTLDRSQEPGLFDLVDRLCDLVGAPRPARIDVDADANASVRFRRGFWSFFSNDLVLTIGLPLFAGLDQRALVGIIAHELGHFRQGTAMRLSYTIRAISGWFFRAVHDRDRCDEWLDETASDADIRIGIVFHAARLCVWISRLVVRVFMIVGHATSCLLLRQMEYDADRIEAAVVGNETLSKTTDELSQLSAATSFAAIELLRNWRSCRVPDNFAHYIATTAADLRRRNDVELPRLAGWFDTHPTDVQRIAHVNRHPTPGVFKGAGKASDLLANYHMVGCAVSLRYYRDTLGLPIETSHLISSAEAVKDHDQLSRDGAAFSRIVAGCASLDRPVFLGVEQIKPPDEPRECAKRLLDAKTRMEAATAKYKDRFQRECDARQMLRLVSLHDVFIRAKLPDLSVRVLSGQYPRDKPREVVSAEANAAIAELKAPLDAFERVRRARMVGALQLAFVSRVMQRLTNGSERANRIPQMVAVLHQLECCFPVIVDLRSELPILRLMADDSVAALLQHHPPLGAIARTTVERVREALNELKRGLGDEIDPFSSGVRLAERVVARVAGAPTLIGCAKAGEATVTGYFAACETAVGFLASLTLDVESVIFQTRPSARSDQGVSVH